MKKIVYGIFVSILIVCSIVCVFLFISTSNMKSDLNKLKDEIKSTKENIDNADDNIKTLTQTYEEMLTASSDKIEEKEIWQETKEKLEQALSQ